MAEYIDSTERYIRQIEEVSVNCYTCEHHKAGYCSIHEAGDTQCNEDNNFPDWAAAKMDGGVNNEQSDNAFNSTKMVRENRKRRKDG